MTPKQISKIAQGEPLEKEHLQELKPYCQRSVVGGIWLRLSCLKLCGKSKDLECDRVGSLFSWREIGIRQHDSKQRQNGFDRSVTDRYARS